MLILIGLSFSGLAQTDSLSTADSIRNLNRRVRIDKIFIVGNKKTRDKIILRELSILQGEEYAYNDLNVILDSDRLKIYNTRLLK